MRRRTWLDTTGLRSAALLAHDTRGSVLTYFSFMAAALVAVAGLTIDVGRLVTTNTQAKSAADASAIAAAKAMMEGRRSGKPLTRDEVLAHLNGAQSMANGYSFAAAKDNGRIVDVKLLTSLPELSGGSSGDPVDAYVTNDPAKARFVEVATATVEQPNYLLAVFGGEQTAGNSASAVAGFKQMMCNVPPLWICNPAEKDGAGAAFTGDDWRGRQIKLKTAGSGSTWSPGNFGLLDGPGGQGTPSIIKGMAEVAPPVCYEADGVDLRPGNATPATEGLNTRFGIYSSPHVSASLHPPAQNVGKGFTLKDTSCKMNGNNSTTPLGAKLPQDKAFDASGRFGNGTWDCASYWSAAHDAGHAVPAGCTGNTTRDRLTRYQLYRQEIDRKQLPKDGTPQCGTPVAEPDRRVVYFAVVNCSQHKLNGNRDDIPVTAFGKGFLTEPADPDVVVEVIDVARPGVDSVLHEIVQLYR